ncbi:hypothetical protein HMPREF9413_5914 [Paenibacillus sp. HGF7]|nr:hypothetical protein HMPREF9413_5914 [Paenibacillus sp. HGF7]
MKRYGKSKRAMNISGMSVKIGENVGHISGMLRYEYFYICV